MDICFSLRFLDGLHRICVLATVSSLRRICFVILDPFWLIFGIAPVPVLGIKFEA